LRQTVSLLIASFALMVSLSSFTLAYVAERRKTMPVLQFFWSAPTTAIKSDTDEEGWILRNVGAGPALNVIVAVADRTALRPGVREEWRNPVLIPAIPEGGRIVLRWLGDASETALGSSYTDSRRYFYTTKCGDDVSAFFVGLHLPRWPLLRFGGRKPVPQWWGRGTVPDGEWSAVTPRQASRRWWLPQRYGVARRMGGWADPVGRYQDETSS
jgi:hypothetical protein